MMQFNLCESDPAVFCLASGHLCRFVAQDTSVPDQTPSPSVFDSQNPFIKYVSEFNSTQKQLNTQIISRINEHHISRVPEFSLKLK